ncbi:MAG: hypothetical protein ABI972_06405 [Acidobacteriota bacterium]
MANNTGLIFGRVTNSSGGSGIGDAEVSLNFITGDAGLAAVRTGGDDNLTRYVARAKSNSDGKYLLPFFWNSVDGSKVTEIATASVLGMKFDGNGSYTSKNQRGRLVLTLDIRKLIAVGYSSVPTSTPEAASIAKDFFASYKDMLPKHGGFYPSSPIITMEVFGLMGQIDISMP